MPNASPLLISLDLSDKAAARRVAQDIADRTGQDVAVTDDAGRNLFTASPTPRNPDSETKPT